MNLNTLRDIIYEACDNNPTEERLELLKEYEDQVSLIQEFSGQFHDDYIPVNLVSTYTYAEAVAGSLYAIFDGPDTTPEEFALMVEINISSEVPRTVVRAAYEDLQELHAVEDSSK